jgi:4a-hydroxytetrahydrobiopterin dehydratase
MLGLGRNERMALMAARKPLTDEEIADRLAALPDWVRDGGEITGTWDEGIELVVRVAAKANELNHHPDIDIRWQRIRCAITTHDADRKLTALDFELAGQIDAIAAAAGMGSGKLHKLVI